MTLGLGRTWDDNPKFPQKGNPIFYRVPSCAAQQGCARSGWVFYWRPLGGHHFHRNILSTRLKVFQSTLTAIQTAGARLGPKPVDCQYGCPKEPPKGQQQFVLFFSHFASCVVALLKSLLSCDCWGHQSKVYSGLRFSLVTGRSTDLLPKTGLSTGHAPSVSVFSGGATPDLVLCLTRFGMVWPYLTAGNCNVHPRSICSTSFKCSRTAIC